MPFATTGKSELSEEVAGEEDGTQPEEVKSMQRRLKKIEEATAHLPPLASGPDAQMQKDGE